MGYMWSTGKVESADEAKVFLNLHHQTASRHSSHHMFTSQPAYSSKKRKSASLWDSHFGALN